MNARLVLACALAGAAVIVGGGTASADDTPGSISFTGDGVPRGEEFSLEALCTDLSQPPPTLTSLALEREGLNNWYRDTAGWWLSTDAIVETDIGTGSWPVTFTCAGQEITKNLLVVMEKDAEVDPGHDEQATTTPPTNDPAAQVPVKPRGAPETGSLAPESGERPVGTAVGVGAVLLGAGGLGAAAFARRRRT